MKVAVLLATYNGEIHLQEQLESILQQSHKNWSIYASDDGSSDKTKAILEDFMRVNGKHRMKVLSGPREGFASNFMSLVRNYEINADYYAFCDQDDVWHPEKLQRAINSISGYWGSPAVYCSRTRLVDAQGNYGGLSPRIRRPPSFANALVQSIAGGNTMVFNNSARLLLLKIEVRPIVSHDWWLYMVIVGAGGRVHYDHSPSIDYRQHPANVIGSSGGLKARAARIKMGVNGRFKLWAEINANALEAAKHLFTAENQETFDIFQSIRSESRLRGLIKLIRSGLHRQTIVGDLGLHFAILIKKF